METPIIQILRDEKGRIRNDIRTEQFLKEVNHSDGMPDVYFTFLIKTLVDDFGDLLHKSTNGRINKEQFEAQFLENLTEVLPDKTRVEEKA